MGCCLITFIIYRYLPKVTGGNTTSSGPANQPEFVSLCKGMFGLMIGVSIPN